ncbi:TetR/AcrR family transcriptional regulator [Marinicella sp. S1101]|uniref:TetR/AcrR family transcriptional regulator n=1 Tax=Marinicella marina TaxID=2996016 RepID=UPI002260F1EB|nr:TetR/AcrR family transcriptional regulator [Marinicella marina]MCX7553427.1 TetR/AcrR family transcriptional regulator [Marinicella marina]MDJ1140051.1 TetR/AcrR family transcriptional regulator [Marinicella marina]
MKQSKKDNILEQALHLFATHGFAHVSISMIAKQAGVTKSLIFHHFENKEQLWETVKERFFKRYAENQMNLFEREKDPIELIRKSMRYYFEFVRKNPMIPRFFAYAHLENDENCGKLDQPLMAKGSELIHKAQAKGLMRKGFNPVVLVMNFITVINQYVVAECHFSQWDKTLYTDPESFIENFIEITIEGIKP